jgi:alginate O-acetyltransferase complex protein AlgI
LFETIKKQSRKLLLLLSIFINIGILFFFKYFDFFIDSFKNITGINSLENCWSSLNIILPVGISFYTFQTLSYTIDIYNRKIEPTKSVLTFFTFVAFFPQLVAGPIERAKRLIPQFEKLPVFSYTQASSGLKLILWGLFKKMVIADQFAKIVDLVFAHPENFNSLGLLLSIFMFGFQIYCDFSGYSDIAVGTARLFGIELMTNFQTPYFAISLRDFWHRWHISLSSWFRDYVYFPLGGNKGNSIKWIRNILLTFVISGMWHGANFTFLIWGFIHGLLFVVERYVSPLFLFPKKLKNILGLLTTFGLVNFSWLFFRAESFTQVKLFLHNIFIAKTFSFTEYVNVLKNTGELFESARILLIIFPIFLIIEIIIGKKTFAELLLNSHKIYRWTFYFLLILSILFFGVLHSAPKFIYFQF